MKIFIPIFILIFCFSAFGQTKKFAATVRIQIISSDSDVASVFESLYKRELRTIGDLTLTDDWSDYSILVFAEKIDNNPSGIYAYNSVISRTGPCTFMLTLEYGKHCDSVATMSGLSLLPIEKIKNKIISDVAGFDGGIVESDRKLFAQIKK